MNLIFKGRCPMCDALIKDDCSDDIYYCDYFYCPNMCYELYEKRGKTMIKINILDYTVKYNIDKDITSTEVINLWGQQVLSLNVALQIDWKDMDATAKKIKSLVIFT